MQARMQAFQEYISYNANGLYTSYIYQEMEGSSGKHMSIVSNCQKQLSFMKGMCFISSYQEKHLSPLNVSPFNCKEKYGKRTSEAKVKQ